MKTYLDLTCENCNKVFKRLESIHKKDMRKNKSKYSFCSSSCFYSHQVKNNNIYTTCFTCKKHIKIVKNAFQKSKTKRFFCNLSCAATYNNKLKRKSRRSKIETKFYNLLVKEFPNLNILHSDKTMLDGYETDVAIPSLKLAIEWNGIVHFKPIYSQTKLDKIQTRDAEKLEIASNKDINLIVIPDLVSNDKILQQAFNDVKEIINKLLTITLNQAT